MRDNEHMSNIDESDGARRTPPPLPWMAWSVGDRVVVRYRDTDGLVTDALGHLLDVAPGYVVVDTKRGPVRVEARTMITGKKVPPSPWATGNR